MRTHPRLLKKYYLEVVKGKITFYVVKKILVSLFDKCFLCRPEEQQIKCLIQILNMTWVEACGHLKGAKLCLGAHKHLDAAGWCVKDEKLCDDILPVAVFSFCHNLN